MIICKTTWFNRWARKQELDDLSLCRAVEQMIAGLYEADLGGVSVMNYSRWLRG